jgi:hypothetical protein
LCFLLPACYYHCVTHLLAVADGIGGYAVAIDIDNEVLYTVPAMGKAGWESMTLAGEKLNNKDKIVAVIGDDQVYFTLSTMLQYTALLLVMAAMVYCAKLSSSYCCQTY